MLAALLSQPPKRSDQEYIDMLRQRADEELRRRIRADDEEILTIIVSLIGAL